IYTIVGSNEERRLTPDQPGLVLPEQLHFVTPEGPMRMQVEFYDHRPR
ncbi:MAG: hemoglobin like protein, partial [Alphaproteobacteria bacterium]